MFTAMPSRFGLARLRRATSLAPFTVRSESRPSHDFERLEFDPPEFDANLGIPGFHRVSGRVRPEKRDTLLPRDIFNQYNEEFWESPEENPRGVVIL